MSSTEAPEGRFGPATQQDPAPGVRELLLRLRAAAEVARTADGAAQLLEAVAREMVAELGRYDRETLATWREVARRQGEAGDPAGAAHLLGQVIPDLARALGANDPETLGARLDLAARTAALGDLGGAAGQLVQLVPQLQQALGEEHPLVGEARAVLGRQVQQLGRLPGAPTGIGWVEAVAVVHRLMVWDFEVDREALDCVGELERRTGLKGLADRIYSAPDHLTPEQVTALALGQPRPA
ncbi:hypothetical protein AB0K43_11950 [Kitasatospora sp. NPDC049258]|uniref:hypothetical protein n=1 Tax=Kitasatospora sp. NPDC049258 TaxID=3155394 RepID=UPI003446DBBB